MRVDNVNKIPKEVIDFLNENKLNVLPFLKPDESKQNSKPYLSATRKRQIENITIDILNQYYTNEIRNIIKK